MPIHTPPLLLIVPVIAVALTGCASSGGGSIDSGSSDTPGQTVVTKVVTQTASRPNVDHATASAPTASKAESGDDSFVMPNEVGKDLQVAQDDIQRVSGNPIFYTSSTDATGAGRMQILDRNWKVCSQNVKAGKRVNQDTNISFGAVKLDEQCP